MQASKELKRQESMARCHDLNMNTSFFTPKTNNNVLHKVNEDTFYGPFEGFALVYPLGLGRLLTWFIFSLM